MDKQVFSGADPSRHSLGGSPDRVGRFGLRLSKHHPVGARDLLPD
jgi:hypothetical protein